VKAFISYAWEDTSTPEGEIANTKLQNWLEGLRDDLQQAGISTFLDIGDMTGDMVATMRKNIEESTAILTINTPRFRARAVNPKTNLGFEYGKTLEKAKVIPDGILPLHYQGEFVETFGAAGAPDELPDLKRFLIRDCRKPETYEATLVATQRPKGIIPAILGIDGDDDKEYQKLVKQWQLERLTRLPPPNVDFTGFDRTLKRLTDAFQVQGGEIQTVGGLGGVGKTSIAIAYANLHKASYSVIRWLSSDGERLNLEFTQMAAELGIVSKGMTNKELTKAIYTVLASKTYLLIFDNADDEDSIREFFPPYPKANQHILITSRCQQGWRNCIPISGFTPQEAQLYLCKLVPRATMAQAKELAAELGYLPLALAHAGAYIKKSNVSIDSYLKVFRMKGVELLGSAKGTKEENNILKTWILSMEKVAARSTDAVKLLDGCADLAPTNIPLKLFEHEELLQDVIMVIEAVAVLQEFSLVDATTLEDHLQVNRLVQAVIRQQQAKKGGGNESMIALKNALDSTYVPEPLADAEFALNRTLLPHAEALVGNLTVAAKQKGAGKEVEIALSDVLYIVAKLKQEMGIITGLKKVVEQMVTLNEKLYEPTDTKVLDSQALLGNVLHKVGDTAEAKRVHEKLLAVKQKHFGEDSKEAAETMAHLAIVVGHLGDTKLKRTLLEKALAIQEKQYKGMDHPNIASTMVNLANVLGKQGLIQEKKQLLERALRVQEKHYGRYHPKVALTKAYLGILLGDIGDSEGSRDALKQVIEVQEKFYGPENPMIARTLMQYAIQLGNCGDNAEKKKVLERGLSIQEAQYGPDHPEVASTLTHLALAIGDLGDTKEKRRMLERALSFQKHHFGDEHYKVAKTLMHLGVAEGDLGDIRKKKELLEQALAMQETTQSVDHVDVATTLVQLALTHGGLGDNNKRRQMLERALKIQEKSFSHSHPDVKATREHLQATPKT
jgi:tetratricopeptide (TPR) repeat protein